MALLGVPFDKVTAADSLRIIEQMIDSKRPHYAATANVDFVVQALGDVELQRILTDADLVLCDGMPLVWASRFLGNALPERVAGADLVPQLLAHAERNGWRLFFLGGTEESVAQAAEKVQQLHPRLQLVGAYSPPFKSLFEMDHDDIVHRVRGAKPDVLLVAFGCPKQEKWISMHFQQLGVPLSMGVGATIDFLAGSVRRAPYWMQRTGTEWIFRLLQEPRRLFHRYFTDFWVFGAAILRQWFQLRGSSSAGQESFILHQTARTGGTEVIQLCGRIDAVVVERHQTLWNQLATERSDVPVEASEIEFIDSTGIGTLVRLQKQLRSSGHQVVLVAPSKPVTRALTLMRLTEFFPVAATLDEAKQLIATRRSEQSVISPTPTRHGMTPLLWQGEIVASNVDEIRRVTGIHLRKPEAGTILQEINIAGVRFIDSTGVRLMVQLRNEARSRGINLHFSDPKPAVRNVLRILRMESLLLK